MNFQTPEEDLWVRGLERRKALSTLGGGLDGLIRRQHELAPFDLSLTRNNFRPDEARIEASKEFLREQLIVPHSLGHPLEARTVSRAEADIYFVEEIEFTATPPVRVPATVVIPKNGQSRHPAIVALHCMGGMRVFGREKLLAFSGEPSVLTEYRRKHYSGRSLQAELARRGYLSIAIDAFHFGMRTPEAIAQPGEFTKRRLGLTNEESQDFSVQTGSVDEPAAARGLLTAGLSVAGLVATDDLRTVDYLCTRDDVDAARIGCAGLSFGSFRANYLSALDERIRAAVSVCWTSTLSGIIDYNVLGAMGFFALPPALYRRMDMIDITALSAPKPFLAISGWRDRLMQPSGTAEAHLRLRKHWQALSVKERFGSLVYDTGHEFNQEMQQAAFDFFGHHLLRANSGAARTI